MSEKKDRSLVVLQRPRNTGQRKTAAAGELSFQVGAPAPPTYMRGDALEEWRRLVDILLPAKALTPADRGILLCAAESYAFLRKLERACARFRSIVYSATSSTGLTIQKSRPEFAALAFPRVSTGTSAESDAVPESPETANEEIKPERAALL